jgi:hypothetical protein
VKDKISLNSNAEFSREEIPQNCNNSISLTQSQSKDSTLSKIGRKPISKPSLKAVSLDRVTGRPVVDFLNPERSFEKTCEILRQGPRQFPEKESPEHYRQSHDHKMLTQNIDDPISVIEEIRGFPSLKMAETTK